MSIKEGQKFTVSDVIDSLGINKFTWIMFVFLGFAMIFDGYDFMVASQTTSGVAYTLQHFLSGSNPVDGSIAVVAASAKDPSVGAASLGALGSSISTWSLLGMVIGGALGGIISDKIGRKKTLTIAIIFYGLFTLPQAYCTDFTFYAATRVIAGLGVGSCIPVVTTCFSETIPSKNRGIFVTFGMAFMVVGWVLAGVVVTTLNSISDPIAIPFASAAMSETFSLTGADGLQTPAMTQNWRVGYLIGALPVIYGVLLGIFMKETPHWYANSGQKDKAIERLNDLVKQSGIDIGAKLEAENLVVPPKVASANPKVLFTKKFIVATAAIWTMYFIGQVFVYGLNPWMIPMMTGFGYSSTDASAMQTFNNVAAICSNVTVGFLSDKFGRKRTLVFAWLFTALAVVVFALTVGPDKFAYCMFLFFFIGFAMNFAITGVQPLMPESYPTQVRNTGVSWCQAFARFGGAAAPIVFAAITATAAFKTAEGGADWNKIMFLLLIPAAIGVICTIVFVRKETSGKDLDTLVTEAVKS
ncbi:MAG: MFS transporter [Coriobacteriales bacterium]|jgi:MFS family permease|nr:MFS transporter [Coriobacteriales bacterium]